MKSKLIVPCNNQNAIHPKVEQFLSKLHDVDGDIRVIKSKSALISRARNEGIFERYIDLRHPTSLLDHDVYAFLDSDVLPKIDTYLETLYSTKSNEVVTGLYPARGRKEYAVGFTKGALLMSVSISAASKVSNVEWAGGGLLFVGVDVLRNIGYPYFHEGVASWEDENHVERATIYGEDVMFSLKVGKAGFKIRVEHELVAEHFIEELQPVEAAL